MIKVRIYTLGPHKANDRPAPLTPGISLVWTFDKEAARREWDIFWRQVITDLESRTKMTPQDYMKQYNNSAPSFEATRTGKISRWVSALFDDEDALDFTGFDYDGVAYKDVDEGNLPSYGVRPSWRT